MDRQVSPQGRTTGIWRWTLASVGVVALAAGAGLVAMTGTAGASSARTGHPSPLVNVRAPRTALHDSQSNNWSGYDEGILQTESPFTSISGTWVVPTATQHTKGQAEDSATWIGIGGGCLDTSCAATDETLIQAGTEQDVAATGKASYSAWWELVPVPSIAATVAVHPGDTIHCSISDVVPGVWSIVLEDATDGQGFTETLPYASTMDTAEWIEETPLVVGTGAGISALPNLSTVSFTSATVNGANPHLVPADAIQLTNATGGVLATPSAPATGDAFDDCTYASSCAAP